MRNHPAPWLTVLVLLGGGGRGGPVVAASPSAAEPAPTPTASAGKPPAPAEPSASSDPRVQADAAETDPALSDPLLGLDGLPLDVSDDPLEVSAIDGPAASLEAALEDLRSAPDEDCGPPPTRVSAAPKALPGRDGVREARLFRVPSGDSCDPEELCVIGLRTQTGWFVASRLCSGDLGEDRRLDVSDTTLSWIDLGGVPVVSVEFTATATSKQRRGGKVQVRWMRLCGAGQSGEAGCTRPFVRWCTDAVGQRDSAEVSFKPSQIVLTSTTDPSEACGGERGFTVGTFGIQFQ